MKQGFTLAEVLITIGIIGVVAAITIPTLIQNFKKQETSARLKKFYSMMSQALIMSQEDNGMIEDWGKSSYIIDDDGKYDEDANSEIADAFFK